MKAYCIWIVEYRADSGKWFPATQEFFDICSAAKRFILAQNMDKNNYRVSAYVRVDMA